MTIIAAVTGTREGHQALLEAMAEAKQLGCDLVAVNLGNAALDTTGLEVRGKPVDVVYPRGQSN